MRITDENGGSFEELLVQAKKLEWTRQMPHTSTSCFQPMQFKASILKGLEVPRRT